MWTGTIATDLQERHYAKENRDFKEHVKASRKYLTCCGDHSDVLERVWKEQI